MYRERGAILKKWSGRVSVAVIFPDTYALGMSNIGFQFVYERLNRADHVVAERFFVPDIHKGSAAQQDAENSWRSVESNRALSDFDLILISISFETGYINVARALHQAGIPLLSSKRGRGQPLVLAGGVACQINPEPVAEVVDAFLLGDFEAIESPFMQWLAGLDSDIGRSERLLSLYSSCPGVYVPSMCSPEYDPEGRVRGWSSDQDSHIPVSPAIYDGVPEVAPHTTITSPDAVFSDMRLIELSRGCGRGCRFCAAGFIYRPPRTWPRSAIASALEGLGCGDRVGMVGLEFLERTDLMELCSTLLSRSIRLAFSSLRADAISPNFVELLRESGAQTATIAIEAGTERLRRIINKNLSDQAVMDAARTISEGGIHNIKCYFMLGLPFEEPEDLQGIVDTVSRIREIALDAGKRRGVLGTITVSASTFVPKAWTPFQWAAFSSQKDISQKQSFLKKTFSSMPNVVFRHDSWKSAHTQAILSRGGREIASALKYMVENRVSFKKAVMSCCTKTDKILKGFGEDEMFPWEIIRHRVKREYLLREWRRAAQARQTSFCNTSECRRCGACVTPLNKTGRDDRSGPGNSRRAERHSGAGAS